MDERNRTSLAVREETHRRFGEAKPYDSLSADEFISELLDTWEASSDR